MTRPLPQLPLSRITSAGRRPGCCTQDPHAHHQASVQRHHPSLHTIWPPSAVRVLVSVLAPATLLP